MKNRITSDGGSKHILLLRVPVNCEILVIFFLGSGKIGVHFENKNLVTRNIFRSGYVTIIATEILSTAIPHRTHPVSSAPGS